MHRKLRTEGGGSVPFTDLLTTNMSARAVVILIVLALLLILQGTSRPGIQHMCCQLGPLGPPKPKISLSCKRPGQSVYTHRFSCVPAERAVSGASTRLRLGQLVLY